MDEQDYPEIKLTEEQWERFEELHARYLAGPKNPNVVTFVVEAKELGEWLLNKYRALSDILEFMAETLVEDYKAKDEIDRDLWALAVTRYANGYLQQRLPASLNAALKGVITEIHENPGLFIEAAFGVNSKMGLKPYLPSKADMSAIWLQIIEGHIDSRFVRENRGGDRRSERIVTDDEKKRLAERADDLISLWQFIIDFFHAQEYEAGCVNMLKQSERFLALTNAHGEPDQSLVKQVFARKGYLEVGQKIPDKFSPLAFALQQAAQEVGLPGRGHDWRRKRYYEGKKLLTGQ